MDFSRRDIKGIANVTPAVLLLFLILFLPTMWAGVLSFTDFSVGQTAKWIGLDNYRVILTDPVFHDDLINNVVFVVCVVALELGIGLGAAILLNRGFPLQKLWVALLIAPYAISPVISVVIWRYLLNPAYGLVNYALSLVGMSPVKWFGSQLTSFIPVIIVTVWKYYPFMMIISYAALSTVPRDHLEAASIDGATRFQTFRYITLPSITPALLVGLTFRIIFVIRTFENVWVLTGGGPGRDTEILSIYLYKQGFQYFRFGRAAAVAWVMLIVTVILSVHVVRRTYRSMFGSGGGNR